ncbi:MAG: nitroreductase family protein [Clostridia bacterium]|nr:nitroreductase family protein [Clostridia bacterium]
MDFLTLATARYSVRKFSDQPVETEKLNKILEAGKIAPTAKNNQPQKIYVLQSADALEKVNGLTKCIYGAKTVLLCAYDKNQVWSNPLETVETAGEVDVSIVATHMMLQAQELGIGSCWVGLFPPQKTREVFGLPENEVPVLLLPLGYPADGAAPSERHTRRKTLTETVKYL